MCEYIHTCGGMFIYIHANVHRKRQSVSFVPVMRGNQEICTWVPESLMPEAVLLATTRHGVPVSETTLMAEVLQSRRKCTVPASAHPQTVRDAQTKLSWSTDKWTSSRLAELSESDDTSPLKRNKTVSPTSATTSSPSHVLAETSE